MIEFILSIPLVCTIMKYKLHFQLNIGHKLFRLCPPIYQEKISEFKYVCMNDSTAIYKFNHLLNTIKYIIRTFQYLERSIT